MEVKEKEHYQLIDFFLYPIKFTNQSNNCVFFNKTSLQPSFSQSRDHQLVKLHTCIFYSVSCFPDFSLFLFMINFQGYKSETLVLGQDPSAD